jgi:hypothetical protein
MGNEEEHFQQSDPPILPILQLKMLPSLSSWAAVHCGLLVLTQQFLAANTQSKPFHLLQSTYAVNTYDIPVTTDLFRNSSATPGSLQRLTHTAAQIHPTEPQLPISSMSLQQTPRGIFSRRCRERVDLCAQRNIRYPGFYYQLHVTIDCL